MIVTVGAALLAVYGAMELLWSVVCRCLSTKKETAAYLLIPLCGERNDAEYQARRARVLCRNGGGKGIRPVLLDGGLSPDSAVLTREICARLRVDFVDEKEWNDFLQTALQEEEKVV